MSNVADELYKRLSEVADESAKELGRQMSLQEALHQLIESKRLESDDFSWSWRMNQIHRRNLDRIETPQSQ